MVSPYEKIANQRPDTPVLTRNTHLNKKLLFFRLGSLDSFGSSLVHEPKDKFAMFHEILLCHIRELWAVSLDDRIGLFIYLTVD